MKRRKKIQFRNINTGGQLPKGTKLPGLTALFRKAGLVDDQGRPTEEGRKALTGRG